MVLTRADSCCTDISAECEACSQGLSVDAFCAQCANGLNSVSCNDCEYADETACAEVMCMIHCENGFLADENGCDTCACGEAAEDIACPEVMCMIHCENGFLADEKGCDTCACGAALDSGCESDADCGDSMHCYRGSSDSSQCIATGALGAALPPAAAAAAAAAAASAGHFLGLHADDCCSDSTIACEACAQGFGTVDAFCDECTSAGLNSVYCGDCEGATLVKCQNDSDCTGTDLCYRPGTSSSQCITSGALGATSVACHDDSDCTDTDQCYRPGTSSSQCIASGALGATSGACQDDSDCAGTHRCYRPGTTSSQCITSGAYGSASNSDGSSSGSGMSDGAVAGVIVGVLAVAVLGVGGALFYRIRARKGSHDSGAVSDGDYEAPYRLAKDDDALDETEL